MPHLCYANLVAIIAAVSSEVHGSIALSHQVDREVLIFTEEVANEIASLVLALHLDLHLPLQDHLLHMERRLIAKLLSLNFASVGHLSPTPGAGDATQEECDDASLPWDVHSEP